MKIIKLTKQLCRAYQAFENREEKRKFVKRLVSDNRKPVAPEYEDILALMYIIHGDPWGEE